MYIHASHTQSSVKPEPSIWPWLNHAALVFNVQVMLWMWCDVPVRRVNEDMLCRVRLVRFDYSCTLLTYRCRRRELLKSHVKKSGK